MISIKVIHEVLIQLESVMCEITGIWEVEFYVRRSRISNP